MNKIGWSKLVYFQDPNDRGKSNEYAPSFPWLSGEGDLLFHLCEQGCGWKSEEKEQNLAVEFWQ